MLKNYLLVAWRNILRNRVASLLNIIGLSVGLAAGILILLEVTQEYSYDQWHKDIGNLEVIMMNHRESGEAFTNKATPPPLAPALHNEFPQIRYAARTTSPAPQLLKAGDKSFYEAGIYADPAFFSMMSFPVVAGDPAAALKQPGSIVVTERTAKKLFGDADPIGRIIMHDDSQAVVIRAVIKDIPTNSSNQFDVVVPFTVFEQNNADWIWKWDNNRVMTWLDLSPGTDLSAFNQKLQAYFKNRVKDNTEEVFAYPFGRLWLHGNFTDGRPNGGLIYVVTLFGIIGIFIILIACINFMSLATAQGERRAKEVGVRKVLGSSRRLIIGQFLTEALLLAFLALLLGIALAWVFLPGFNQLTGKNIQLDFLGWKIWASLLALGLLTGVISGSYPAFYLSRFSSSAVLKGTVTKNKGGAVFRKILVTFQYMISIFLIIGTIVVSKQIQYLQDRPIGYEQESLIEIPAKGMLPKKSDLVKEQLLKIPTVRAVTDGSDNLVQFTGTVSGLDWPGKQPGDDFGITVARVRYDFTRTTGIKLAAGRDFSRDFGTDTTACLINEAAVRKMRLKEPIIGARVGGSTVIGVMDDFVYNDPSAAPKPMIVYFADSAAVNHLLVRFADGSDWKQSLARIEEVVKRNNPDYPFEFHFTREEYQKKFFYFLLAGRLVDIFGVMAIIISCLGLFGLSAFIAERRTKEIGIRRVLGASVGGVWLMLTGDFMKPILISFLLATPLALWSLQKLLHVMNYHIALSWWMFASGGGLALLTAVVTVSYHGIRTASANPTQSLRRD